MNSVGGRGVTKQSWCEGRDATEIGKSWGVDEREVFMWRSKRQIEKSFNRVNHCHGNVTGGWWHKHKIVLQVKCYWELCIVKYHLKSFRRIFHNVCCDYCRDSEDISWPFIYITLCAYIGCFTLLIRVIGMFINTAGYVYFCNWY